MKNKISKNQSANKKHGFDLIKIKCRNKKSVSLDLDNFLQCFESDSDEQNLIEHFEWRLKNVENYNSTQANQDLIYILNSRNQINNYIESRKILGR